MINWLCDTNVVSELMRRDPDEHVFKWAAVQEHFRLSVITVEEINCGLQHRNLPKKRAWCKRRNKTGTGVGVKPVRLG